MKQYRTYQAEDFSMDQSFIDWIKSGIREREWKAWLIEHPEKAAEVDKARSIVQSLKFVESPIDHRREEKVWSAIDREISKDIPASSTFNIRRLLIPVISIAAAIALLYTVVLPSTNNQVQIETPYAVTKEFKLPDGSSVAINAESSIEYNKSTWKEDRSITLNGEGFFEVEKGSRFTVVTPNGNVEVLGTSFNVFSRNDLLHVVCMTGKVGVNTPDGHTILLPKQGMSAMLGQPHSDVKKISPSKNRTNWQSGIYHYKSESLIIILAELERRLDIRFEVDQSLQLMKFTGSFDVSKGEDAISEVLWPLGLKYEKNGNQITITK